MLNLQRLETKEEDLCGADVSLRTVRTLCPISLARTR